MATPLGDPDIPLHHIPRAPGTVPDAYHRLQGICHAFPEVGGIGVRLDEDVDWDLIAALCTAAFRHVAPPSLVAEWDARASRRSTGPPTSREELDISIDT